MQRILKMPRPTREAERLPALATADLRTTIDDEPRISDLVLAERLGFMLPRDIRKLIRRSEAELLTYGALPQAKEVSCHRGTKLQGGRPALPFWLNEGQALTLCALARTSNAARIRRELVTVFMAWRRGELAAATSPTEPTAIGDATAAAIGGAVAAAIGDAIGAMRGEMAALRAAVAALSAVAPQQALPAPNAAPAASGEAGRLPPLRAEGSLLFGAAAIGRYLGISCRQVYYLHHAEALPTFKVGKTVCADPQGLVRWIASRAAGRVGA